MRLKAAVWGLHGVTLHSKFVRSHSAGVATISHSVTTYNLPAPARSSPLPPAGNHHHHHNTNQLLSLILLK
jgi:hypothetical protein